MEVRTNRLVMAIQSEFDRLMLFNKNVNAKLEIVSDECNLQLTFTDGKVSQSVNIPLPMITKEGIELLQCGDVVRVLCNYWLENKQVALNYHEIMEYIVCKDVSEIMPEKMPSSSLVHKIINSFKTNMVPYMVHQLQRLIGEVVNAMPLHETNMNSWAMNNRLIIVDPEFHTDMMKDPNARLDYQVRKNDKYYSKYKWTSIGLSDGTLADKNLILKGIDLRDTIPFGHHHNPQRNLYSTLGMKGDELPRVRSKTMHDLINRGISRTGWNLTTAIMDIGPVFEDQILLSNRHKDKGHTYTRRYAIYGDKLLVNIGDNVEVNGVLGFSNDGDVVRMDLRCDNARVIDITDNETEVSGEIVKFKTVKVEGFRLFRDGTKFSNLAGNKGIVRMMDLGYAVNPKTGESVPIDVIISASSIDKRMNFSQILEALTNNICDSNRPVVIPDDKIITKEALMAALKEAKYPEDGSWVTHTMWGERQAICGKMFWGVTKDSEDAVWDKGKTHITNNRELRISGLKFSHVEFKALTTRFGPGNAITKEIMTHAQGTDILIDEMKALKSIVGELPTNTPTVLFSDVPYVDNTRGMLHTEAEIAGTVVDEMFFSNGFILCLPVEIQAIVPKKDKDEYTIGIPQGWEDTENYNVYQFDKIYIPNAFLRRCWKHPSGKWGFSTLGAHINHILERCHQFDRDKLVDSHIAINHAVVYYINELCRIMGSKRGDIATYGMSVRYPHSARATATLSNDLPENTIEIHRSVANRLGVVNGDVVLVERFPCLGFMSVRPQYIKVTDDDECLYTFRVSGNCLVSMDLDFDGDTIFIAAFKTPEAIELLQKEMLTPNEVCEEEIRKLNNKKQPRINEKTLNDYDIVGFPKMTVDEHSNVVRKLTGVKAHTGPVIALAYNLMRIVERNVPFTDTKQHASLEIMLHFLGNTVFQQKHGVESLQEAATDALCMADVDRLVELGFEREPSKLLCDIIVKEAKMLGINDLVAYHLKAKEKGWSKIINKIVRAFNKVYFASRATLKPFKLIEYLEADAVDLPSKMLKIMLQTPRESVEKQLQKLRLDKELQKAKFSLTSTMRAYAALSEYVDTIMIEQSVQYIQ